MVALRASGAILLLVAAGVAVITVATPAVPPSEPAFSPPLSLEALPEALAAAEARVADLRPGSNRKVVLAEAGRRAPTGLALVYLHGFSASRQEITPVAEQVAKTLGANLYFARIPGHGRSADAMAESSLESWQQEGESALAVGRLLGGRVVLIGTSTSGTLATWLAARHPDVAGVVLISPNFGVQAAGAGLAAWPGGEGIVRLTQGSYREFKTHTPLHAQHWTWRYSSSAIPPMMQLVAAVKGLDVAEVRVPVLVFYSPQDTVVRPDAIKRVVDRWGAARKRLVTVTTEDPSRHVLAGDALSPGTTSQVVAAIVDFLRSLDNTEETPQTGNISHSN